MAVKSTNMWSLLSVVLIVVHLNTLCAEPDQTQKTRVRRQYYVCPPEFKRISNNCYFMSSNMATWQDAHYACRDRHSELAILSTPAEDKKLRGQLNKPSVTPLEWWIGGIYDWEQMQWKWGASGKKLEYHGFSRMGPENKEKLKWHCTILDPMMKYKWSARSCVLGKHYICQKKVDRVNRRGLEKLRKKYNNTLNEIPAPYYAKPIKPRKHENLANGNSKTHLKHHRPNGINIHPNDNNSLNNAFGHRRNATELRKARKRERKNKNGRKRERKNRNNRKNFELRIRNGTDISAVGGENGFPADERRYRKRNRRNKSKESKENSAENSTYSQEELKKKKKKAWSKENSSMEDITQRTTFLANTISPLHPRIIIEEHDFMDLNLN